MPNPQPRKAYDVSLEVAPGAYLDRDQARRAFLFGLVLSLVAGRNVHIAMVWDIAVWMETGKRGDK